jgi:putative ABC transport system permease protein
MFNAKTLTRGITALMGRGKSMPAVLRTSIAYSLRSRFRTGMTIAIFALIIFSITTMSMIVGILGTNIESQVGQAAGGYDIMAYTLSETPIPDIQLAVNQAGMGDNFTAIAALMATQASLQLPNQTEDVRYQILGVDDTFIANNTFEFKELLPEYETSEAAWNAIKTNSDLIIIDSTVLGVEFGPPATFTTELGSILTLRDKNNNTMNKTIIGIMDTVIMQGIYSYDDYVQAEFGLPGPTFFLFSIAPDVDGDQAAKELERTFLRYGMQTVVMKTLVQEVIRIMNQFFNLFESFMGLGLVIGIAGLGIITIRSVHERRQEIGMMRAIGFQRRMVLTSFLVETSFVAVIGIVIGTLLGIFIGYTLWLDEFRPQGLSFMINWQPIVLVGLIALTATLLSIFPASRRAANVPPAEALRFHD